MTIVSISKNVILKALKTERLTAGHWIYVPGERKSDLWSDRLRSQPAKNCKVCAVGAVIRNAVSKKSIVKDINALASRRTGFSYCDYSFKTEERAKEYIENGNYMDALNTLFEGSYDKLKNMREVRSIMVKFVKENFPEKIELDIGEMKPSAFVRRV